MPEWFKTGIEKRCLTIISRTYLKNKIRVQQKASWALRNPENRGREKVKKRSIHAVC